MCGYPVRTGRGRWVHIPALPFTTWVTLSQMLNVFEPMFCPPKKEAKNVSWDRLYEAICLQHTQHSVGAKAM